MKTRTMLGALIMAALIGSSVGVGYAGGGGEGDDPDIFFYQCYGVEQGSNPPYALSLNDQFTDATVERVGKLKFLCTLADWSVVRPQGVALTAVPDPDHITCYEVSQAHATKSVVTLNDAFGEQTVKVQGPSKLVCTFATKTCLSGCPVTGP